MSDDYPQWEHSPRRHGLWWGNQRIGYVGLTPPGFKPVVYSAYSDVTHETTEWPTLAKAKRFVEQAWKKHAGREPAPLFIYGVNGIRKL